jgi:glycyl-tRNA synthetase beta chain
MFAVGLQPTGSKDPFALRRAANGIVKIISEHKLPLPVSKLFADARAEYVGSEAEKRFDPKINFEESIKKFMEERLEFYLKDVRGFAYDVVKAVLAAGSDDVVDAIARAEAVSEVRGSEDFASIAVAFKRMKNIVLPYLDDDRHEWTGIGALQGFWEPSNFEDGAERGLAVLIPAFKTEVQELARVQKYKDALLRVAELRKPVDTFFDKVMVMVEDEQLRHRRILMLLQLLMSVSTIADFSEIVTEGK